MRPLGLALAALAWMPLAIQAQKAPPGSACVFDTAAHRDTDTVVLYLRVRADGDTGTDPVANAALAATLRPRWHPPETLGRMFYPYTVGKPALRLRTPSPLDLEPPSGVFSFTVSADRHLRDIFVRSTSGDSATDASLIAALQEAEDEGDAAPFIGSAAALGMNLMAELYQTGAHGGAPLIRVHVPRITIDSPVVLRSVRVRMTPAIRKQGQGGSATMRYVVNEAGRVEPASLHAVESSGAMFAVAARDALLDAKFEPARTAGCPVKMLVEERVKFTFGEVR